MLKQITSRQLTEWEAFCILEPFGPRREEERFAILAASMANCSMASKKDKTPFLPEDFFPSPERFMEPLNDALPTDYGDQNKQTPEEMLDVLMKLPGLVVKNKDA